MKRLFILSLLITSSYGLLAQLDQGNFRIGGTAGFSMGEQGNSIKKRDLYISPTVAYFLIDRLSIGLSVPFQPTNLYSQPQRVSRGLTASDLK